jgi:hypothetical protein
MSVVLLAMMLGGATLSGILLGAASDPISLPMDKPILVMH